MHTPPKRNGHQPANSRWPPHWTLGQAAWFLLPRHRAPSLRHQCQPALVVVVTVVVVLLLLIPAAEHSQPVATVGVWPLPPPPPPLPLSS